MIMFCVLKNGKASRWYDYPQTVEEFVDSKSLFFQKDVVFCFVENEHVWIYEDGMLYERPDLPEWVPDYEYPEYDF